MPPNYSAGPGAGGSFFTPGQSGGEERNRTHQCNGDVGRSGANALFLYANEYEKAKPAEQPFRRVGPDDGNPYGRPPAPV